MVNKQLSEEHVWFLKQQHPVLDRFSDFVFLPHNKCAQRAIVRESSLTDRVVVKKDDKGLWNLTAVNYPWQSAFKFTVVRNPFDRVVSAFFYLKSIRQPKIDAHISFCDFVKSVGYLPTFDPHFDLMTPRIYYRGQSVVDFVARVEQLQLDWFDICSGIGIKYAQLPFVGLSDQRDHYSRFYDEETKRKVGSMYADDLQMFKYTFETSLPRCR